jgi:glucose-6-phosphate isomerase
MEIQSELGKYQSHITSALHHLKDNQVLNRIWNHDHTLWKPDPIEITNRLGWLNIAGEMLTKVSQINTFAESVRSEGYTQVLLLGMGGSSLAPEVFRKSFGIGEGCLELSVLDSTDPDAISFYTQNIPLSKTLFIVASKSGGTVETLSFFRYFFNQIMDVVGENEAGKHFIAITDPGSKLVPIAEDLKFRGIFLNDPDIGGRFSALSYFGLIPAALIGIDIEKLLSRSLDANPEIGALLGAIMGVLAEQGRDKVTFWISEPIKSFGDWVEQLIAESTGKEGEGILPVINEAPGDIEVYGQDRLFINVKLGNDLSYEAELNALQKSSHPIIRIIIKNKYDLGNLFFTWELATAVAGHFLEINPFNQPNVESAKILARKMVAEYQSTGSLPSLKSKPMDAGILISFLENSQPGDYISLQAYLKPDEQVVSALQEIRLKLRDHFNLATTLGFGPRYLHSTGQLHKGDAGNGLFIQFISDPQVDIKIPDKAGESRSSITFDTLKTAQALGDGEALIKGKRRFIRFHLGKDVLFNLEKINQQLEYFVNK